MRKQIKNDEQYENALYKVYSLMQMEIKPESKEFNELEKLTSLIKEYECVHYPIEH